MPASDSIPLVIALASDHAGWSLKNHLRDWLEGRGHAVLDLGTNSAESVDYPEYGRLLAQTLAAGRAERGIAVCGTGIGISIAVNRHPAARAALCQDTTAARLARQHNDANVLALGARLIGPEVAEDVVATFLATDFEGGRHARRVALLG